jgi:oryzin
MMPITWRVIILLTACLAQAVPMDSDSDVITDRFIVQLKPGISAIATAAHHDIVRALHSRSVSQHDSTSSALAGLSKTFSAGDFNGYSGTFEVATIAGIAALPEVLKVEPDRYVYPATLVTQYDAAWHLASLSHRGVNSTDYIYDDSAGEGTFAYVVDSGIRWSHEDFEDRASMGCNAVSDAEDGDQMGHGTHVASILAGKLYDVAKKANVIDVKVFGDGAVLYQILLL